MKQFSRVIKPLIFATVPLTLVLSSAFLPSRAVSATASYPTYSKEITYYSDAGHTNYVGTGMIYCNGRGTLTGTSSPYHTEEIIDVCCGSVPC